MLFKRMSEKFADLPTRFYDEEDVYQFQYSERQLESVEFASLLLSDAALFAQEPVFRKARGTPETYGWVDFWVGYRKIVHLIEFKFQRISIDLQHLWDQSSLQLKNTPVAPDDCGAKRKVFKSSLLIAPFYKKEKINRAA